MTKRLKSCIVCKQTFLTDRSNKITCSKKCADARYNRLRHAWYSSEENKLTAYRSTMKSYYKKRIMNRESIIKRIRECLIKIEILEEVLREKFGGEIIIEEEK